MPVAAARKYGVPRSTLRSTLDVRREVAQGDATFRRPGRLYMTHLAPTLALRPIRAATALIALLSLATLLVMTACAGDQAAPQAPTQAPAPATAGLQPSPTPAPPASPAIVTVATVTASAPQTQTPTPIPTSTRAVPELSTPTVPVPTATSTPTPTPTATSPPGRGAVAPTGRHSVAARAMFASWIPKAGLSAGADRHPLRRNAS